MKILVTGGAGFIGSHIVDVYIQGGHEVWVVDDLSGGKREQVNPHARFVRMDLCSPDLKDVFAEGRFDCVNHHAAQVDARASIMNPGRDAALNIGGTLNLLEAMRAASVPCAIFASTGGAIYGGQGQFPSSEQHPTIPLSPYGVAKRAIEQYLEYYHRVHALKYIALRYAKVYGPRQDPERGFGVVAIFCGRILSGQQLIIYGNGQQTRDYVYVQDVARANLLALKYLTRSLESVESTQPVASVESQHGMHTVSRPNNPNGLNKLNGPKRLNGVFNIGTGIETSVNALTAMLLESADIDCPVVYQSARPGEQTRSVIDPSLAKLVLGWEPLISLAEGLDQTLAWFRTNHKEPAHSKQQAASTESDNWQHAVSCNLAAASEMSRLT